MASLHKYLRELDYAKLLFATIIFSIAAAEPSYAQNFSGIQAFLTNVVNAITGPIGIAISSIAVMAVGFSFMTGRMDWTFAVSIVLGIAIVFGAATFTSTLTRL
ncbi:TrbC/VirB2 family protein [Rhizobium sp. NFACC06-2]|uniref:TrbC/VirB2 family protein n=1 Tax=Rhizobium sp. NFACC06-2 TaxID=1566264 RepID=UPI000875F546|nr:TrbC/VirB2 family protein [Rhizobium sp. NFACC06-2]SCY90295.1 type IV secretion system protein VirB2 [Rhizobium sp. NFACC06-2]